MFETMHILLNGFKVLGLYVGNPIRRVWDWI